MTVDIPGDLAVSFDFFETNREELEEKYEIGIDEGPGGVIEVTGSERSIDKFLEDHDISRAEVEVSNDDGACEACGAPAGMRHDAGCPANEELGPDPDRFREGAGFDKFMDRIVIEENRKKKVDGEENNPQRQIARKYQDRPNNRTVIRGGNR